jgi:hypothetical protein
VGKGSKLRIALDQRDVCIGDAPGDSEADHTRPRTDIENVRGLPGDDGRGRGKQDGIEPRTNPETVKPGSNSGTRSATLLIMLFPKRTLTIDSWNAATIIPVRRTPWAQCTMAGWREGSVTMLKNR